MRTGPGERRQPVRKRGSRSVILNKHGRRLTQVREENDCGVSRTREASHLSGRIVYAVEGSHASLRKGLVRLRTELLRANVILPRHAMVTPSKKAHRRVFLFFSSCSRKRFSVHVKDVVTGKDLPDVVEWCKFGGITWEEGARGFFYSAFPRPKSLEVFAA